MSLHRAACLIRESLAVFFTALVTNTYLNYNGVFVLVYADLFACLKHTRVEKKKVCTFLNLSLQQNLSHC